MKLIDLLVKELPSRGGWTFGRNAVYQDWDGELRIDSEYNSSTKIFFPLSEIVRERAKMKHSLPDEAFVTREQYEAALKPVWNGEGLPPVGTECELVNFFGNDFPDFVGEPDEVVEIIGNGFTNGCPVAFYEADGGRGGVLAYAVEQCFRPIRTEAERQRDKIIAAMRAACTNYNKTDVIHAVEQIHDAIAAHKITGVTLVPTVSQIVRITNKCSREDAERIITMLTGGTITE